VENIEFYSNHSWINSYCKVRPVVVPIAPTEFPVTRYSGCWTLFNLLHMYLNRSKANFLYYIDDSAYLRPSKFLEFLKSYFKEGIGYSLVIGYCFELRDYFRGYLSGTGILISRSDVEAILKFEETWSVMCECELPAEEAIGHALMQMNRYSYHRSGFLSRPFLTRSDYLALMTRNFSGLPECMNISEKTRSCTKEPSSFADLIVWNGVSDEMGIEEFLDNAAQMMKDVPKTLGFHWGTTKPSLCFLPGHHNAVSGSLQ
jgi:hypothetical protein